MILKRVKATLIPGLSKLNPQEQNKEFQNISTLGNIQELDRVASDTAGLLTLYYREQITMIDTSQRMPVQKAANRILRWLKDDFIGIHAENNGELSAVVVADYITGWLFTALKAGGNQIRSYEPIPQQLWLFVAKYNPMEGNRLSNKSDSAAPIDNQLKVWLKTTKKQVPIRYLIGCLSIVSSTGEISQFDAAKHEMDPTFNNLEIFGYAYVSPFSERQEVLEEIIEGRKLVRPKHDKHGNMLTRVQDIIEFARIYQSDHNELVAGGGVTMQTVEQMAQLLRERKYFLDANGVQDELEKSKTGIALEVETLREDIRERVAYYQTSIEATREQLHSEALQAKEELRKTVEKQLTRSMKELNEHMRAIEDGLKKKVDDHFTEVEQKMEKKSVVIQKIADQSRKESAKARQQATEANQASQTAADQAVQALSDVKAAARNLDQAQKDFQKTMGKCQSDVQQAITQSTVTFEKTISEVRQKVESNAQRTKEAAERAAAEVKDSSRLTKESAETTQTLEKTIREQIEGHRKETGKLLDEVKEIRKQNTRLAEEARNGTQQAKEAAEQAVQARSDVKTAAKNFDQSRQNFEKRAEKCETDVQQAIEKSTVTFEKTIAESRQRIENNAVRTKEAAEQAKDSARLTKESADTTRKLDRSIREQLGNHKKEIDKLLEEMKEIKKQNASLMEEARKTTQQAREAAEKSSSASTKTNRKSVKISETTPVQF